MGLDLECSCRLSTVIVDTRGLERTLSHISTKVSTSTKLAARKVMGGIVRGVLVLAHMNTAKWQEYHSKVLSGVNKERNHWGFFVDKSIIWTKVLRSVEIRL